LALVLPCCERNAEKLVHSAENTAFRHRKKSSSFLAHYAFLFECSTSGKSKLDIRHEIEQLEAYPYLFARLKILKEMDLLTTKISPCVKARAACATCLPAHSHMSQ
jgi:hypothetical protein